MITKILQHILVKFAGKEGEIMMAMFFAQRVILGKTEYKDVPATLKPQVKEILEESGLGFLAEE